MQKLAAVLPQTQSAAIFLVLHTAPNSPGLVAGLVQSASLLPVSYAENGETFEAGRIYVAPADRHMLLKPDGTISVTYGPKENRFRPAIDPLFRSAAVAFGPDVTGVILSGGMDDGVSGLAAIRSAGGRTIVQSPEEAIVPDLPRNALRRVPVDHCLPVEEIAKMLLSPRSRHSERSEAAAGKNMQGEVQMAHNEHGTFEETLQAGEPSLLTCPECHGALLRIRDDAMLRYRCHTGHAYTAASLDSALIEREEEALWNAIRIMEESAMLLGHMARHFDESDSATAAKFRERASQAMDRTRIVRRILGAAADADDPQVSASGAVGSPHHA